MVSTLAQVALHKQPLLAHRQAEHRDDDSAQQHYEATGDACPEAQRLQNPDIYESIFFSCVQCLQSHNQCNRANEVRALLTIGAARRICQATFPNGHGWVTIRSIVENSVRTGLTAPVTMHVDIRCADGFSGPA